MKNFNLPLKMIVVKLLVACIVGIVVITRVDCAWSSDFKTAGLPIQSLATNTTSTEDKKTCDKDKTFDCKNCTARAICDSAQNILAEIVCDANTPFCNDGICSTEPPKTGCPRPASPLCPTNGTFPSTASCTRYVKCSKDKVATEYQCPINLVYDPVTEFCKRRSLVTDCPTINCIFSRNKFIVYPPKKQIYFFCGTTNNDIKVLSCPADEEFNPTAILCEKVCKDVGFMAARDKTKFYLCVKNGNDYDKYLQECPSGTTFEQTNQSCV